MQGARCKVDLVYNEFEQCMQGTPYKSLTYPHVHDVRGLLLAGSTQVRSAWSEYGVRVLVAHYIATYVAKH